MRIFPSALSCWDMDCKSRLTDSRQRLRFQRIVKLYWKDKASNKTVREKVEGHCTRIDLTKQRKLKLLGWIWRMKDERPVKAVMLEMIADQQETWCNDITDWCGCTLPETVQLALDRKKWRRMAGLSGPPEPSVLMNEGMMNVYLPTQHVFLSQAPYTFTVAYKMSLLYNIIFRVAKLSSLLFLII